MKIDSFRFEVNYEILDVPKLYYSSKLQNNPLLLLDRDPII